DRLPPRVPEKLVCARKTVAARGRPRVEFLRCGCKPTAFGMEAQRLDPSGRSARLVPVVLPLLHGPAHARGRSATDRALESDPPSRAPGAETLRARQFALPAAAAASDAALGLRQPQDLSGLFGRQINFDGQIPKKGDQRQMENWQRIGTYAAGLALDSAGAKGKTDILSRMDMIVAAGGGERDLTVDSNILSGIGRAANPAAFLNERLMSDLRPTLFLAQLSNLLAGNISIVHGVTGSSRTFMGEESAGIDAVRIAHSRIGAGQSDIALVGGSYNGERPDLLMLYEFAELALKNGYAPIWERRNGNGGFALASLG